MARVPTFDALDTNLLSSLVRMNLDPVEAIPTPFPSWNNACREGGGGLGLGRGYYVVLGAATGHGKSTIAISVAAHAVRGGYKVGFLNFEMTQRQIAGRYLSILTGADHRRLEAGPDFDYDYALEAAVKAGNMTQDGQMLVNRHAIYDGDQLTDGFYELVEMGADLIIVDYLQLIHLDGVNGLYERTEAVSNLLRTLVHRTQTRGIALSQITTTAGRTKASPPTEYDLFGGGKWAQDANQVLIMDHTDIQRNAKGNRESKAYLRKNRHGPLTAFNLEFDTTTLRYKEVRPQSEAAPWGQPDDA
jgi:replicative DNA helicase